MCELSDEQRLIQETARDFVDNEVIPRARDSDRAAKFDACTGQWLVTVDAAGRLREIPGTGAKKALDYLDKISKSAPDFRRAGARAAGRRRSSAG